MIFRLFSKTQSVIVEKKCLKLANLYLIIIRIFIFLKPSERFLKVPAFTFTV